MANVPLNLVPKDLRNIAKEISVQVLTNQPKNIYKFIAEYLNEQLGKRERKDDEIFIRDLIECDLTYEAMLKRWGVSLEAAHKASAVMQAAVRRFLEKQKVKREREKIDISMDPAANPLIDDVIMSAVVFLQKESQPGDAELLNSSLFGNPLLLCMNPGISEEDIIRAIGPATLDSIKHSDPFDEREESVDMDDALLTAETNPRQETNEDGTKNFAKSMLIDIISRIFENDALLYGKSFDQEMEHLSLVDDQEIVTRN